MEWVWLGAIGVTGGIIALIVLMTIVTFAAKPKP